MILRLISFFTSGGADVTERRHLARTRCIDQHPHQPFSTPLLVCVGRNSARPLSNIRIRYLHICGYLEYPRSAAPGSVPSSVPVLALQVSPAH